MKLNPQYINIAVLIGSMIVVSSLNLSFFYVLGVMSLFGFVMYRKWLKLYFKDWMSK